VDAICITSQATSFYSLSCISLAVRELYLTVMMLYGADQESRAKYCASVVEMHVHCSI